MKATVKTITPHYAKELLKRNPKNRPISLPWVDTMSQTMTNGHWLEDGSPIRLDKDGYLLDGQQRLSACVKSGIEFLAVEVTDLNPKTSVVMDDTKRRSMADALSIDGEANAALLAATLTLVDKLKTQTLGHGGSSYGKHQNYEGQILLNKYPEVKNSVDFTKTMSRKAPIPPACVAAAHYLFWHLDPGLADKFITAVCKGFQTSASPAWLYRELMFRKSQAGQRLGRYYILSGIIKAWNLTRKSKTVSRLIIHNSGKANKLPTPV